MSLTSPWPDAATSASMLTRSPRQRPRMATRCKVWQTLRSFSTDLDPAHALVQLMNWEFLGNLATEFSEAQPINWKIVRLAMVTLEARLVACEISVTRRVGRQISCLVMGSSAALIIDWVILFSAELVGSVFFNGLARMPRQHGSSRDRRRRRRRSSLSLRRSLMLLMLLIVLVRLSLQEPQVPPFNSRTRR